MLGFVHSGDLDGYCSGAIIKLAYPNCEIIPINYGDDFPWGRINDPDETVWMADFSLEPFSDMIKLAKMCNLIWIDHHKTSYEAFMEEGSPESLFKGLDIHSGWKHMSACEMVWRYIYKEEEPEMRLPRAIKLLSMYDIWDHSDPDVLPFQYGMRSIKNTLPTDKEALHEWNVLFTEDWLMEEIIETGKILLEYIDSDNEKYCRTCAFPVNFEGLKCIAINRMMINSKVFDSVWDENKYDMMIGFGYRKGKWYFSIYSTKNGVDVSKVAEKYGGGGHAQAAGFQCSKIPFDLGAY